MQLYCAQLPPEGLLLELGLHYEDMQEISEKSHIYLNSVFHFIKLQRLFHMAAQKITSERYANASVPKEIRKQILR